MGVRCFDDCANPQQPDTWHFNHESGYVGVINYAVNAKNIIPWIEDYMNKDVMKDKCAGIVVTDFVGAHDHGDGSDDPISSGNGITQNRILC